jgi:hypothetical protein
VDEGLASEPVATPVWPSIDDVEPVEEGGAEARQGFNYQDEVAVSFLLAMLDGDRIRRIWLETHDDLVVVRCPAEGELELVEYVQVKGGEIKSLWSVASLCAREKQKPGSSIFEASLARDRLSETARFRMVTMRQTAKELAPLAYRCGSTEREAFAEDIAALTADVSNRLPGIKSPKGNECGYWLQHCEWDTRHDLDALKRDNLVCLLMLTQKAGTPLLFEQLEPLLDELRDMAKEAGAAKWKPYKAKKVITRAALTAWLAAKLAEIAARAGAESGKALAEKLEAINVPSDAIAMARELRLRYGAAVRTPRYLEADEMERLQWKVQSRVTTLRAQYAAGQLDTDGLAFHALCIEAMDVLAAQMGDAGGSDASDDARPAFLKGCLYDITDRCMLRFEKPGA